MKDLQYNQKLTLRNAAEGIELIRENSKSLLEEAELLYNNKKYPRAFSLAVLSIEEISKVHIIRFILVEDNQKKLSDLWKDFRNHTEKNWALIFLNLPVDSISTLENIGLFLDNKNTIAKNLDFFKQLSFFTDRLKKNHWNSPNKLINKQIAENAINKAKILLDEKLSAMTTLPELELWVKHLQPIWKNQEQRQTAFINCYTEAQQIGVLSGTITADDLIQYF